MALWITEFFGAATVGTLHKAGKELEAGAAGAEVLLTPRAAPTARPGHRDGHKKQQQPLLSVFPSSGSQHGSADPGNAVQELVEGVRPQQCCGELCCQIGLYYFIFFTEVYGLGILQNLAVGSNIK